MNWIYDLNRYYKWCHILRVTWAFYHVQSPLLINLGCPLAFSFKDSHWTWSMNVDDLPIKHDHFSWLLAESVFFKGMRRPTNQLKLYTFCRVSLDMFWRFLMYLRVPERINESFRNCSRHMAMSGVSAINFLDHLYTGWWFGTFFFIFPISGIITPTD